MDELLARLEEAKRRKEAAQQQMMEADAELAAVIDEAIAQMGGEETTEEPLSPEQMAEKMKEMEDKIKMYEGKTKTRKGIIQRSLDLATAEIKRLETEIEEGKKAAFPAPLPSMYRGLDMEPNTQTELQNDAQKSVNFLRYASTELDGVTVNELSNFKAMQEIYDGDYREVNDTQNRAFERFLRAKGNPNGDDIRPLYKMYFPIKHVAGMLKYGATVEEIKTTQIEGAAILGGVAVPPERANAILQRTMGLTAVRQAGATVVQTASKMIEWVEITDGTNRYPSSLRGAWGHETQSPAGSSFKMGLMQIPVHLYTYKVPFSVSLLEDADNIVQIFERLVADTIAMDEDDSFLVGDGANKARGLLPGQANALGLTEVVTGDADDVTMNGLKKLRRGIDTQYRMAGRASLVGNSQTGEDIELFTDGEGRYFVEALTPGDEFMGGRWFESEALPDPAANTFPLIYGDFSGYAIVERLGLTIQRYNDSNTGINVVEYQIRRRLGGRCIEPWKFAINKCSL